MLILTLKDIPKRLYQQLTKRASLHRRSLSQEAVACLQWIAIPERAEASQVLRKARALRARVKPIRQRDLDAWLRGRSE